jgi:hypothetical protein
MAVKYLKPITSGITHFKILKNTSINNKFLRYSYTFILMLPFIDSASTQNILQAKWLKITRTGGIEITFK